MALDIVFHDGHELTWHIGQKLPIFSTKQIDAISHIQADGDELQHIMNLFSIDGVFTIPMPKVGRVIRWFGDIAKTIIANI